jgi:hypothetical protein
MAAIIERLRKSVESRKAKAEERYQKLIRRDDAAAGELHAAAEALGLDVADVEADLAALATAASLEKTIASIDVKKLQAEADAKVLSGYVEAKAQLVKLIESLSNRDVVDATRELMPFRRNEIASASWTAANTALAEASDFAWRASNRWQSRADAEQELRQLRQSHPRVF